MPIANTGWSDENRAVWDAYERTIIALAGKRPSEDLCQNGFCIGHLPEQLAQHIRSTVELSPRMPFMSDALDQIAIIAPLDEDTIDKLNRDHEFLHFDSRQLWALYDLCEFLGEPVAAALGCCWCVLNVRGWLTRSQAELNFGPNAWHADGDASEILKIMVYLSDLSNTSGGLEICKSNGDEVQIYGPSGTWVLFYNSRLLHRGRSPTGAGPPRFAVEITLAPWTRMQLKPVCLGQNARHPRLPLQNAISAL